MPATRDPSTLGLAYQSSCVRSVERSSDQVVRPVNLDALDKWVGQIPADVRADMAELAPMLSVLGYDPWGNPPEYRTLLDPKERAEAPAAQPSPGSRPP